MFLQETYTMIEMILQPKFLYALFSFIALMYFVYIFIKLHRSDNKVDLVELFVIDQQTGKQSDSKVRLNTAFVLSVWAFVYLVMNDKFTDWFFFGFMGAWVTDRFLARYQQNNDRLAESNYNSRYNQQAYNSRYDEEDEYANYTNRG